MVKLFACSRCISILVALTMSNSMREEAKAETGSVPRGGAGDREPRPRSRAQAPRSNRRSGVPAPTDLTVTGLAKALRFSWAAQERRTDLPQ